MWVPQYASVCQQGKYMDTLIVQCCDVNWKNRPSMNEVIFSLTAALTNRKRNGVGLFDSRAVGTKTGKQLHAKTLINKKVETSQKISGSNRFSSSHIQRNFFDNNSKRERDDDSTDDEGIDDAIKTGNIEKVVERTKRSKQ